MASRKLARMGLAPEIATRLRARGLTHAADVLQRTDVELMHLLDLPYSAVQHTVAHVSSVVCPPCCTVQDIVEAGGTERLPTQLPSLDAALGGGLPCGSITELVGPAGLGKTQMCLMLAVQATLPVDLRGFNGKVVLFDTEHKFSSQRLVQIACQRFPFLFNTDSACLELVEKVLVISPSSTTDLLTRLSGLQGAMVCGNVCLVLVDSVAALLRSEYGRHRMQERQEHLGQLAVLLKQLAEGSGVPVVVTNQVSSGASSFSGSATAVGVGSNALWWAKEGAHRQGGSSSSSSTVGVGGSGVSAGGSAGDGSGGNVQQVAGGWTAALGTKWAHCANVRLGFGVAATGDRCIHIAKAPMAPPFFCFFEITPAGVEELVPEDEDDDDDGGGGGGSDDGGTGVNSAKGGGVGGVGSGRMFGDAV